MKVDVDVGHGRGSWSYKTSKPKFPILLPRNSHITELLVQHYHEKRKNQGRTTTLNEIRLNGYWIISGTSSVSRHILRRVKCLQTSASATIHLLRRGLFRAMDHKGQEKGVKEVRSPFHVYGIKSHTSRSCTQSLDRLFH